MVGSVIVHEDSIIGEGYTSKYGGNHAEVNAIHSVQDKSLLKQATLYVTLEPCPMCAGGIALARLRRIYYGAADAKSGGVDHGPRVFSHPTCHHRPEVIGGVEETRCGELLTGFFAARR